MSLTGYLRRALAGAALVVAAGTASASTVTSYIYLGGFGGYDGQDTSYSYSSGALGLTTTGHLLNANGSIGTQVKIGQWLGGLGVHSGRGDEHFVDSNGADEVVKFLFNMAVKIEKIWFSYVDRADDFAFSVLDGSTVKTYFSDIDINGLGIGSYTFAGNYVSNTFGIGAAGHGDAFKIKAIQVSYDDTPAPIPLPAAGWLLLASLGGMAALRKGRRG